MQGPPLSARLTMPQIWGIVLLAPYVLVFLAFVVYPVGYGLWLARHPASYVALYHDPIFARAAVNAGLLASSSHFAAIEIVKLCVITIVLLWKATLLSGSFQVVEEGGVQPLT